MDRDPPSLLVDSNVLNEVMTPVDLLRAIEELAAAPESDRQQAVVVVETTRLNVRGSLWLAMALDDEARTTVSLGPEHLPWTIDNAPRDSWAGGWVATMAHYGGDDVFSRWRRASLDSSRGSLRQ